MSDSGSGTPGVETPLSRRSVLKGLAGAAGLAVVPGALLEACSSKKKATTAPTSAAATPSATAASSAAVAPTSASPAPRQHWRPPAAEPRAARSRSARTTPTRCRRALSRR